MRITFSSLVALAIFSVMISSARAYVQPLPSNTLQFLGSYQTTGESECLVPNPLTHSCQCFGANMPFMYNANTLELQGLVLGNVTTTLHVCYSTAPWPQGNATWGGVFQIDDQTLGSEGCRAANPVTGACSCPLPLHESSIRVARKSSVSGLVSNATIGSTISFCMMPVSSLQSSLSSAVNFSFFGGIFSTTHDSKQCAAPNSYSSKCSCASTSAAMASTFLFASLVPGSNGNPVAGEVQNVSFCVPGGPGIPSPTPPSAAESSLYLYVATTGRDENNNGTSILAPLRTIQKALDKASFFRQIQSPIRNYLFRNITIRVFEGVYFTEKTIQWNGQATETSSSSCGSIWTHNFVKLEAFPSGSKVVVSGGAQVVAKAMSSGSNLYSVILDRSVFTQEFVWQVWTEAADGGYQRVPLHATETMPYDTLVSSTPPIAFTVPESQVPPYKNGELANAFAVMYHSWTSTTNAISTYNAVTRTFTLQGSAPDNIYNSASGNRYRLVNVRQLDKMAPGTYFFNKSTFELVFAGNASQEGSSVTLVVPRLATILNVAQNCENIMIEGIVFAHTDSFLDEQCLSEGCSGQSGTVLTTAAVEFGSGARRIWFNASSVSHVGGYALWVHGSSNTVLLLRSSFSDLGAGGIRIGEPSCGAVSDRSSLASNVWLSDSLVYDGGYIVEAGCGVLLQQAASCTIEHNAIHDLYYTAISTGWTWGYTPTSNNNIAVRYNELYNLGRGVLSDMGCIYNLGTSPGTVFDHNVCHDLQSFGYGGWGLYSDEGTSFVQWTNNIVYRTKSAPYHQHYGHSNLVVNNVFAFPQVTQGEPFPQSNGDFAAVRSSPAWSGPEHSTSFSLLRNILLLRNASATLFFATIPEAFVNVTCEQNVYFNDKDSILAFPTWTPEGGWSTDTSIAAWRLLGKDLNSALTDPLFTNADGYDFSHLSPDSPALKLGFVPIDMSACGPRSKA